MQPTSYLTRRPLVTEPAVAGVIAWKRMRGPRSLRGAQVLAWATLLLALPLIMALTYLTVTPICFG